MNVLARWMVITALAAGMMACPAFAQDASPRVATVLKALNDQPTIKTTDDNKSYKLIWDAYLKLTPPPMPVGPEFNLNTIHPKMSQWPAVAGWAWAWPPTRPR